MMCIYCKSSNPEKFKKVEHVVPQGFGRFGTQTPTLHGCVCDDCNSLFGQTIDQYLTRETLEGVVRYNKGILSTEARPQTRLHITLENAPENGGLGGMKVAIDGSGAKLMPVKAQYLILNQRTGQWEHYFKENIRGIQLPEDVYGKPGGNGVTGNRQCKVFALSKEEHDEVVALLQENGVAYIPGDPFIPMLAPSSGNVSLLIEGEVTPEHRRAHAKIFLNLIAFHLGCDEAMKPHWDFLRRYVRFGEGAIRYSMDKYPLEDEQKRESGESVVIQIKNVIGHVVGTIRFYGNPAYHYILRERAAVPDEHEFGFIFTEGNNPEPLPILTGR